ncbi:MAG: 5-methyltetrahydropteroyltriglutamate--homocysteine methyltransferase [Acidimicrobiales bacterium]
MKTQPLTRADQVGSLLRPESVKQAWVAFEAGELDAVGRREVEDEAARTSVRQQEATGIGAVSDGEFRRDVWWSGFIPHIHGIEITRASTSPFEHEEEEDSGEAAYVPKLLRTADRLRHPGPPVMGHDHAFLASLTNRVPKVTIPAPSRFHFQYGTSSLDPTVYPDRDEFWADVAAIYQAEIAGLEAQGCRFIQLDDPVMSFFCDPEARANISSSGEDPDELLGRYVGAVNDAVSQRSPDTTIGLHICRGNARSAWAVSGGYAAIAEQTFSQLDVDVYYLEFDDERAGDFQPLAAMPDTASVVLGLVTSKRPKLESPDELKRRLDQASAFIDPDRLALSPQCGFASILEGNLLTEADQWAKLELVAATAHDYWG